MNKKSVICLVCLSIVWASNVWAQDTFTVAAGKASQGIDVLRLAWQHHWSARWLVSESGELSGFHALSANRWQHEEESINSVAYSPVFVYRLKNASVSYIKFGLGAAYLSDTRIKNRQLSTHFQFENQLGIGWQWKKHDLGLMFMHYSNAGIEKPNHGIDMLLLSYTYRMD